MTKPKAALIALSIVFVIWLIVPKQYYVLVNNECAPHHKVTVNGQFVDCTGPDQSPANMPIPEGDLPWLMER